MAEFGESCSNGDEGCAGTLVCVELDQAGWLSAVGFANDTCLCDYWYGWSGENCDQLTSQSTVLIVSTIVQLIMCTAIITVTCWAFLLVRKQGMKLNAAFTTSIFGLISVGGVLGWRTVSLAITLNPGGSTDLLEVNGRLTKSHQLLPAERAFLVLVSIFSILTFANVSLMWIQIAQSSKKMSREMSSNLDESRKYIVGFEIGWTLVALIMASLGFLAILSLFLLIPILVIIATYAVGRAQITKLLVEFNDTGSGSEASKDTLKFNDLIGRIYRLSLAVIVCLSLVLISSLSYGISTLVSGQRDQLDPRNTIHYVVILTELNPFFLLIALAAVTRFTVRSLLPNRFRPSLLRSTNAENSSSLEIPSPKTTMTQPEKYSFIPPISGGV